MRKLTPEDINSVIGKSCAGYVIERARVKGGRFCDSDNYGIAFGRQEDTGHFATWHFHFEEDGAVSFYWGRYFLENEVAALQDFETRF